MFALVVLGLVSSAVHQEIDWEERLQKDLPHADRGKKCALDSFVDFGIIYIVWLFTWLPHLLPFSLLIFSYWFTAK